MAKVKALCKCKSWAKEKGLVVNSILGTGPERTSRWEDFSGLWKGASILHIPQAPCSSASPAPPPMLKPLLRQAKGWIEASELISPTKGW